MVFGFSRYLDERGKVNYSESRDQEGTDQLARKMLLSMMFLQQQKNTFTSISLELQGREILKSFFQEQDENGKSQFHTRDYSRKCVQNAMAMSFSFVQV